jgi:hypothetical protein
MGTLTIRIDDDLLAQVKDSAALQGISVSEFVCGVVADRLQPDAPRNALEAFGDYVGFISCGPTPLGQGDEFGDILEENHQRQSAAFRARRAKMAGTKAD